MSRRATPAQVSAHYPPWAVEQLVAAAAAGDLRAINAVRAELIGCGLARSPTDDSLFPVSPAAAMRAVLGKHMARGL